MSQPSTKRNKALKLVLKLAIAAAALAWVFTQIDPARVWSILQKADYAYLVFALILFVFSKITSSLRLNIFFRNHRIFISEKENLKLYWLGMFYNIFLPGGVSGDAYKIYLLKKKLGKDLKELFGAVFVDRLTGVVALTSFAFLLLSFTKNPIPFSDYAWLLIIVVLGGFALLYKLFFKRYLKIYLPVVAYSFLVQGLQVLSVLLILKGFGISDQMTSYIFVFLISSLVAIIPISVGGAGTRELAFLYGAQYLALSPEVSVTVSLTFYLITLFTSLFGMFYSIRMPVIEPSSS
ncbi:MAG: flippase-like domain-containing protein [Bacteroidales bacterium]|nr:flippase-like domain-containing protein [Bacteroidales bacterium]MCF8334603.1 flippase-like domain-containing protein [Bacteroidales bacterium]